MLITTIEELQEDVGLLKPDNPLGIVYQAVEYSAMYDLLKDYLVTVDFQLYYKYSNRYLLNKYHTAFLKQNYDKIKQAILYALLSEEYRLKTLIETTTLEYDPLESYDITETIVTTATISANIVKGQQQNKRDTSQIVTKDEGGNSMEYGEHVTIGKDTTDYGENKTVTNQTDKVSPYNNDTYKPAEQHDGTSTNQAHKDEVSTSKTSQTHKDVGTDNNTRTQEAFSVTDNLGQRKDKNDRNDDINKNRRAHGRYGYVATQALIKAERELADLSIVEEICKIVLRTICSAVTFID